MLASYRICALRGRGEGWHLRLEIGGKDAINAITSVAKDNLLLLEYNGVDKLPPPQFIGIYEYPHGWRRPNINSNIRYIGTLTQSGFESNNFLVFEYGETKGIDNGKMDA